MNSAALRLPASGGVTIACDAGGTFTDLIVGDDQGLRLFKATSTPDNPITGILTALERAAAAYGASGLSTLLARCEMFIHATTRATNAILTGNTARTAFLTTEGHRDVLLLREGGRLHPYDNAQEFPRPYVPLTLTFEVPERIGSSGTVVRPLDEAKLADIIDLMAMRQVEAVGVCFLWSIANPVHELRAGEMIAERFPALCVTLSHRLNPIVREYRRASSACIDASLKPLMGRYLVELAERLADLDFRGRLLIATSQGGFLDARTAAEAPIHLVKSGPSVAPIAGRHAAWLDSHGTDVIVTDAGGTSYDVSLIRNGRIPLTTETWLGPRFNGHLTGFPSVDVRSIGAGGGSIAWLDDGGLLHVGPKSAGAVPGPACYGRGGNLPTVTDCALALGYLDKDRFVGGQMCLDAAAARRSIELFIATPLRVSVEAAALAIIDLLTQNMVSANEEITVQQGIDPREAALIAGGGAAGFNSIQIGRKLGCVAVLFPETGAVLSTAGAMLSDLVLTAGRVRYVRTDAPDFFAIEETLRELIAEISADIAELRPELAEIDYWVEARYPQQTWEIEVPLRTPLLAGAVLLKGIVSAFHDIHEKLYAVCDRTSPVEIIGWRAKASCRVGNLAHLRLVRKEGRSETDRRKIFLSEADWTEATVQPFHVPEDAGEISGPAIVESPFTTIVIPGGSRAVRLPSGTLKVELR
jgi:N-methylhydantoinase A